MKTSLSIFLGFLFLATPGKTQQTISLSKTLGGAGVDKIKDLLADGNGNIYALCRTDSMSGDVNCLLHGHDDIWLLKIDGVGNILWQHCYGGSNDDDPYQLMQTSDGGLLFTGTTFSSDGDVSGYHGTGDVWVVKLDTVGEIIWQRCIGGSSGDRVHNSIQLQNGDYAISCETLSSNGDFTTHHGGYLSEDAWIVLLNSNGTLDTSLIYGGSDDDMITEIIELPNREWQLFGNTYSTDFDLSGSVSFGYQDGWVFRSDTNGVIKWTKRLGSDTPDFLMTAGKITSNIFLTAGSTSGFITNHGAPDLWIMKLDSMGNLIQNYTYGGAGGENSTYRTRFEPIDSNQITLAAYTYSPDGDVGVNYGYSDYWALKLDTNGVLLSSAVAGGSYYDDTYCNTVRNLSEIYLGGLTLSDDFDVEDYKGGGDGWLVMFSDYNGFQDIITKINSSLVYPNPAKGQINICVNTPLIGNASFELFSIDGSSVLRKVLSENASIPLDNISRGFYQYILRNNNQIFSTGKIIIQ